MAKLVEPVLPMGTLTQRTQPEIGGAGLVLRPWQLSDAKVVLEAHSGPEIQQWHARIGAADANAYDEAVDVVELGQLSDAQRAELQAGEEDPFDAAGNPLRWRPKDRHVALRRADGRLIASAGLVLGDLQVEDRLPMRFVGLGGVFVTAACRGQGLGKRIIHEALRRAGTMGPDVVLLFCYRNRIGLYEQQGFVEIDPPVLVQQPDGYAAMPLAAMWRALRDDVALPPGRVVVHSLPF